MSIALAFKFVLENSQSYVWSACPAVRASREEF